MTDPIIAAAQFLLAQLDWCRHATDEQGAAYAVGVFAEIGDCAGRMRSLVEGPAAQRYLGPCGAVGFSLKPCCDSHNQNCEPPGDLCCYDCTEAAHDMFPIPHADGSRCIVKPCEGDVYGRAGADKGRCKTCGAQVSQDERLEWIDELRREWLYTATEIADAYPSIKANTVSQWLSRGLIATHGKHGNSPLYKVGDVLDLAAGDAARREEARAARARRREGAS